MSVRSGFAGAGLVGVLLLAGELQAIGPSARPENLNCGTAALLTLLRWEGRPATWEAVQSRLGNSAGDGHSMKDLRDAAREFGLELRGVKRAKGPWSPDRAAIASIRRGEAGHFVAVRPVERSGTLVQVQDGARPPEILDAADLETVPGWTGLMLTPARTHWGAWAGGVAALAIGAAWVGVARRAKPTAAR